MATEIFIPKMGANIEKVTIGKTYIKLGNKVKKGDILFEIVTDKATFDVEADDSGTILQLNCKEGEEVNVLKVVGLIGNKNESPQSVSIAKSETARKQINATPKAKKLAKENNIDIENAFSGTETVVKEEDILKLLNSKSDYSLVKLSSRKNAEILTLSQTKDYLYSSVTVQASMSDVKKNAEKIAEQYNLRLPANQYLYYCATLAILEFPNINACYSNEGIRQYKNVNLGIAINLDSGLIVPVIKNVNMLSIDDFLNKYGEIVLKVMKNETSAEDFQGGTFTISDLSSYKTFSFSPVINKSQSAILGISSEYDSCKLKGGKLVYDQKTNLTLAFDHRVLDGKYALMFLHRLNKIATLPQLPQQ